MWVALYWSTEVARIKYFGVSGPETCLWGILRQDCYGWAFFCLSVIQAFRSLLVHLVAELLQEKDALLMFGSTFYLKKILSRYFPGSSVDKMPHSCICITQICWGAQFFRYFHVWPGKTLPPSSTLQKIHFPAKVFQSLVVKGQKPGCCVISLLDADCKLTFKIDLQEFLM